jgi:two-component system, NarL family, nitrate/nitrite response regulator NarL
MGQDGRAAVHPHPNGSSAVPAAPPRRPMTLPGPGLPAASEMIGREPASATRVLVLNRNEVIRRGLGSMLGMLPGIIDITDYEDATAAPVPAGAASADIMIVSPEFVSREPGGLRESLPGSHPKILLMLRDHDMDAVAQASAASADGFLLESELTTATLGQTLSRVLRDEMPMPTFLARELLTHLRTQDTRPARRPFLLTQREIQTLSLLVEGLSNKQIARRLGVSENGAKRHVANVLAKMNCPNRTVAVALVVREGLLDGVSRP